MGNRYKYCGEGEKWWSKTLLPLSHVVKLKQNFPKCNTEMDKSFTNSHSILSGNPRGNSTKYYLFLMFILHPDSSFPLTLSYLYLLPSFPS